MPVLPNWEGASILLIDAGAVSRYNQPHILLHDSGPRGTGWLNGWMPIPDWVKERFHELDFGSTGARRLLLHGSPLLHVAAEYGSTAAASASDRSRRRCERTRYGGCSRFVGGQTPIFHAVTQFEDRGLPMTQLLLDHWADLSVRVKLPGHYERPDEVVECTPLGYALLFPVKNSPAPGL